MWIVGRGKGCRDTSGFVMRSFHMGIMSICKSLQYQMRLNNAVPLVLVQTSGGDGRRTVGLRGFRVVVAEEVPNWRIVQGLLPTFQVTT